MGVQYTVRQVPQEVDAVLRKQARRQGISFNAMLVEVLAAYARGKAGKPGDAFSKAFGVGTLDDGFDEAIASQSGIDESLWQ